MAKLTPEERDLVKTLEPVLDAYDDFLDREDAGTVARDRTQVLAELALAKKVTAYFAAHPERYAALVEKLGVALDDWLEMLPFDLQEHGMIDEALAINAEVGRFGDGPGRAMDRAQLHFLNGQMKEAIAVIETVMATWPERAEGRLRAAQLYAETGDRARAAEYARALLAMPLEGEARELHDEARELLASLAAPKA